MTEGPSAAFGEDVRAVSTAAETVQDLLGADRDRRLFAAELEAIIDEGVDDGSSVADYRFLAERVRHDAAERIREVPAAMHELEVRALALE